MEKYMSALVTCGLTHEINNLLTVILAHADSLTAHCSSSPPAREHLDAISNAAHRIAFAVYSHESDLQKAVRQTDQQHQGISLAVGK